MEFSPRINLISGQNGQGKTNLVEAVMLNALSKSPRTAHDEDLKMQGETHTEAEVCVSRNYGDVTIKCVLDSECGKKFFINSNVHVIKDKTRHSVNTKLIICGVSE